MEIKGGIISNKHDATAFADGTRKNTCGIFSTGTFTMKGGTVAGNTVNHNTGAGVRIDGGTAYIEKGRIIYNATPRVQGAGIAIANNAVGNIGLTECSDKNNCTDVIIANNSSYYSGKDLHVDKGSTLNIYCGKLGALKVEAENSVVNMQGGTLERLTLQSKGYANIKSGIVHNLVDNGGSAGFDISGDADVTRAISSNIDPLVIKGNVGEETNLPVKINNIGNAVLSQQFKVTAEQKPFLRARIDGNEVSVTGWIIEDDYYIGTVSIPAGKTVILTLETNTPAVTYKQISGKAQTQNNDPLLIIGTVTGDEALRPEGRLFYMFSGSLTSDKLDEFKGDTDAMQAYGEGITRVMDTAGVVFEPDVASGTDAETTYNGYSELLPAEITFADDETKMDEAGKWTKIPDELLAVPVRISLGQDVTRYYSDLNNKTEADENEADYRVDYTYEYTTLAHNNGNATTLGELFEGNGTFNMSYSDVAVFKKENSDWAEQAGFSTDNISGLTEDVNYNLTGKFDDIKDEILGYINDDDTTNDFWNKTGSSFGLYITYEYISSNVCLSKYVPMITTGYETACSNATLLTPDAGTADFTYKVFKKNGEDWNKVNPIAGEYVVDFDDSILITAKDSETYSGTPKYNVSVQDDAVSFSQASSQDVVQGVTAAFTFTPSEGANEAGLSTPVTIRRAYDGTYAQVDKEFTLVVNPRVDAQIPTISVPSDKLAYIADKDGNVTATLAPSVTVTDGGTLSYQWYEVNAGVDEAISGAVNESLDISQTSLTASTTQEYKLVVTNTNNASDINGSNTATASATIQVDYISRTDGKNIAGGTVVYSGDTVIVLPAESNGGSVDSKGNITIAGGTVVTNSGTEVTIPAAITSVTVPLSKLSEIAYDKSGNVIIPSGSMVNKDLNDVELVYGGKITPSGEVKPNTPGGGVIIGGIVTNQKPDIETNGEGIETTLNSSGTELKISIDEGYELVDVTLNGVSKGVVTTLSGLKTGDVVVITSKKTSSDSEGGSLTATDIEGLLAKMTPVARSSRTAKRNTKILVKMDEADRAIIEQIENAGYTIKYNFYRSTKKTSKYKAKFIPKSDIYINTIGVKGTMYYYKMRVQVYDSNGKLVARTELKQCKYANRLWVK